MTTKQIAGVIYRKATLCKTTDQAEKIAARHISTGTDAQVVKQGVSYAVYVSTGDQAPRKQRTSNIETHEAAVKLVSEYLDAHGIPAQLVSAPGVDMVLDDGRTVLVRAKSEYADIPLMNGTLDTLNADIVIAAVGIDHSNVGYHIMDMDTAKYLAEDLPYKDSGRSNWFIHPSDYRQYKDNCTIIKTGVNALPDADYIKHAPTRIKMSVADMEQLAKNDREEGEKLSAEIREKAEIENQAADQRREAEYLARVRENN